MYTFNIYVFCFLCNYPIAVGRFLIYLTQTVAFAKYCDIIYLNNIERGVLMNIPKSTDDYRTLMYGENLELIKAHPLFAGLGEDEIKEFIEFSKPSIIDIEPGRPLLLTTDADKKFGVVIKGGITIFATDCEGNRAVINTLKDHGSLGPLLFMVHYYNLVFELSADVPSRAVLFDPHFLRGTCREIAATQHRLTINLLEYSRGLFISISEHLLCLSQKSIRDKVLRLLFFRCEAERAYEFDIHLSREEMADYLAVDRASLSRTLGELKREGVIDFKKSYFKVLDTKHFKY